MTLSIAAVVVLYNPDKTFIDNIYTYLDCLSLLVVVDNSEKPNKSLIDKLSSDQRVKIITNYENTGIAKAINDGIRIVSELDYKWVLTMDQDSYFEMKMLNRYIDNFNRVNDKENIAVLGPVFSSENIKEGTQNVTSLITSGSYINISIFNSLGGYDEKLFIDEVDHEYCYRAKIAGYKNLQFQDIFLEHSLGKKATIHTLSGKIKTKTFHSPLRLYYITRNSCHIISMYKNQFPKEMKQKRKDLLIRIKNHLIFGSKKWLSLKYTILGFYHYIKNRFGKL